MFVLHNKKCRQDTCSIWYVNRHLLQIVYHKTLEKGGAIRQGGLIDNDPGALRPDALHAITYKNTTETTVFAPVVNDLVSF